MRYLRLTYIIVSMGVLKGGESDVKSYEVLLGQQVRSLRKSRGFTQQQVAERANLSWGAVKNLEGGRGATLRTLTRVLRALNADDWLTTLYVPESTFNPLDLPSPTAPSRRARRS